ncbi:HlyC/CorC family transporter [Methylorubrum populi]
MDHTEFWLAAGIVLIALILSAFCAGAETAFTAASRARMLSLENAGSRRATLVNRILEDRERFIGAMLIGYNVVAIGASAFTAAVFTSLFGREGVLYATAATSVLVIVFAQVLPKTLSINNADRIALASARPVAYAVGLLGPLALAVEALVRAMLRPLGLSIDAGRSILTPREEIRGQVALLHREGGVGRAERDMLGGLLDLNELTVSEVMVHRTKMRTIDASLPSEEIVRAVLASPYTRMPLWRDSHENIVGVLHAKDLLRALDAAGGEAASLKVEALALETWFVPGTTTLRDQLKAFLARKTHFALVVDEYGEVMGLVTLEDILEEIVGEIADEHDVAVSGLRPQSDGSVHADGSVPIRDLNRAMDWNLPDAEATTVAGLVIHEARAIPDAGTAFNFHGFRFQVLRKAKNRITTLRITPLAPSPPRRTEEKI